MALETVTSECAVAVPELEHRRAKGVAKESRRQYSGARERDKAQRIDYSDPFVRALLSPSVIGRIKEILAEEGCPPLSLFHQPFYFCPDFGLLEEF